MTAHVDIDLATAVAVTTGQPEWAVEITTEAIGLAIGIPGPQGTPGEDGVDGVDGADGADGATGEQGPPGEDGVDGAQGPEGPQGQPGGSTDIFRMRAKAPSITGDPGPGFVRWNNVTQRLSTVLAIDVADQDALDVTLGLSSIAKGNRIYLQDYDGPSVNWQDWEVTGPGVALGGASGWWEFPVKLVGAAGTGYSNFVNGLMMAMRVTRIGPGYVRDTITATSPSLANGASWQGSIGLPPGYRIYRVTTDRAARVRTYTNAAAQIADAARVIGVDPVGNHGLMLEYVTTPTVLTADLSPMVDGYDVDADTAVAITVTNLSGATATVSVTFIYVRTE